jgi:hypothetical protein
MTYKVWADVTISMKVENIFADSTTFEEFVKNLVSIVEATPYTVTFTMERGKE